ncbi:3'-5' exonuclease [Microlunatus parietis]|uniref:DNA polymerase III alpha subunit (Gram-positive type) n=1 Tax=Microlunatus parietis TaxID=682979 RepID=A0A7Y9I4M6_9ACTN|nr:3'-5' exonuclease [Microlunatus parietis]NYE70190.1 DNA polymerase III alpha subunit (gram-positive type) [Microlunatus parietis]
METFVVFDLEFTSWPGANAADWSAPGQLREIIQIAALRLAADTYEVVDEFEALVRPVQNPTLSPYVSELTGIEQGELDRQGRPPAAALGAFLGFCRQQVVVSYGNDMVVLGENVGWARSRGEQVANGFLGSGFVNLRPLINSLAPATASANAGRLWSVLGLPRPGAAGGQHSALFDCHSLAVALRELGRDPSGPVRQLITASVRGTAGLGAVDPQPAR